MRSIKYIFFISLFIAIFGCNETERKQTLIIEQASPNSKFVAQIIKIGENYRFAVKSENKTVSIVDEEFTPAGYHNPRFSFEWNDLSSSVQIKVDHDFGENNLLFEYNLETLSWLELKESDS